MQRIMKTVVLVIIFLRTAACLGCSIPLLRAEELKTDITQSKDKANLLDNSRAKWQPVTNAERSVLQLHESSIERPYSDIEN